jgi:hypothetical protein
MRAALPKVIGDFGQPAAHATAGVRIPKTCIFTRGTLTGDETQHAHVGPSEIELPRSLHSSVT